MKQKALVILIFSIWILIGGIIVVFTGGVTGKFGVNNINLLLFSLLVTSILFYSAIQMVRGKKSGYFVVVALLTALTLIFAYRFYTTRVIAPPGVGLLMTLSILLYMLFGQTDNKITKI